MSTSTLTLTEFLLARIAEDEAHPDAERLNDSAPAGACWKLIGGRVCIRPEGHDVDRARILAECEAKRRIIELWRNAKREAEMSPAPPFRPIFEGRLTIMDAALRALALAYQDHPEYADEWDPRK